MTQNLEKKQKQELWITIFVHGSYGSFLGAVNPISTFTDSPGQTLYKKIISDVRKRDFFYSDRLMSDCGLINVQTLSHKSYTLTKHDAIIQTLVNAYDRVDNYIEQTVRKSNNSHKHVFYLFGWSGLLSQTERRKEAIKLYTELSKEIQAYRKKNIEPKVRVICHSHGGNVGANLASVHACVTNSIHDYPAMHASHKAMQKLLHAQKNSFDLQEHSEPWHIDELILYATPIQFETECLFFSPFFKNVYNFYSENDTIQAADFISTQYRYSRQRIATTCYKNSGNQIIQSKIMVNRSKNNTSSKHKLKLKAPLRGGKLISKYPEDPTHADFWCVCWSPYDTPFAPLPIVVFTPMLIALLQKNNLNAIDVNLQQEDNCLTATLFKHNGHKQKAQSSLPNSILKELKQSIWDTQPSFRDYAHSLKNKK